MLERSFLDSIKADPNDELARLAYADWLEEQSDPRADFLRAEAEHFSLSRTPPSLLRVSELAARASLDWLAEASLMAVALRTVWNRVGKGFRSTAREESAWTWEKSETRLADFFDAKGLVVPYDYSLFQTLFPGGWFRDGGRGVECAIWAGEMVRQRSEGWMVPASSLLLMPVWLAIGVPYSDHEEHFLSCSPSHPRFGHVVVTGDDMHPSHGPTRGLAPSFLAYLKSL